MPHFTFRDVSDTEIDEAQLRRLWRILSLIVCLVVPVVGSLWLMWFVCMGDIYENGVKSTSSAIGYMTQGVWGGHNRFRIGNEHGGEFFPLLTNLLFIVVLLAYLHFSIPVWRALNRSSNGDATRRSHSERH